MAITSKICTSYKVECFQGIHQAEDTYKIALYTSSAVLDASTTAYTATGEVSSSGTGYSTGGQTLVGFSVGSSGEVAYLDFTTDPSWSGATFTARGALIYNSSRSNKAVAVFDFGQDKVCSGSTFLLVLPFPNSDNALIRWS